MQEVALEYDQCKVVEVLYGILFESALILAVATAQADATVLDTEALKDEEPCAFVALTVYE